MSTDANHSFTLLTRLTHRLFGAPLLRNSIRGEWVEELVSSALEPEWILCADNWGACDLRQVSGRLRIQVKQSAARQNWHSDASPKSRPRFSIAQKKGRYEDSEWIAEPSRNADLFIFGWHPIADMTADHRNPDQWLFYVIAESDLPARKSLGLPALERLSAPVVYQQLRATVDRAVGELPPKTEFLSNPYLPQGTTRRPYSRT